MIYHFRFKYNFTFIEQSAIAVWYYSRFQKNRHFSDNNVLRVKPYWNHTITKVVVTLNDDRTVREHKNKRKTYNNNTWNGGRTVCYQLLQSVHKIPSLGIGPNRGKVHSVETKENGIVQTISNGIIIMKQNSRAFSFPRWRVTVIFSRTTLRPQCLVSVEFMFTSCDLTQNWPQYTYCSG